MSTHQQPLRETIYEQNELHPAMRGLVRHFLIVIV